MQNTPIPSIIIDDFISILSNIFNTTTQIPIAIATAFKIKLIKSFILLLE